MSSSKSKQVPTVPWLLVCAAEKTGVPAKVIERLAHEYATTQPAEHQQQPEESSSKIVVGSLS